MGGDAGGGFRIRPGQQVTSSGLDRSRWWNGLRFRLVIMMSVALLPIGLIAVTQTRAVSEEVRRNTELALLAGIEQTAFHERLDIQRAFGVADSVAALSSRF